MSQLIKMTTPGEWIVTTSDEVPMSKIKVVSVNEHGSIQKDIAIVGKILIDNSTDPLTAEEAQAMANAALIAIAPDMLDALITIQAELNTSKDIIDLEAINEMISNIFSKLANEAGEER
jgi:hypothetical protein